MQRILVCIDFSKVTEAVIEQAKTIARLAGAEVRVLHVGAPDPDFVGFDAGPDAVRKQVAQTLREEHKKVEDIAARLSQDGIAAAPMMVQGPTAETILDQARRFRADLVVLGSHGHGALFHLLVGSVTQGVLRDSRAPVLVVPSERRGSTS